MQHKSDEDRVFLGLIWKVDKETEEATSRATSNVEKLQILDLLASIWEVLEKYTDVFPSEVPQRVPPLRMSHEFKIDLEDKKTTPTTFHYTNSVHSS